MPPFLAGITTALSLIRKDFPHVVEHFPQSVQTDHKQSEGSTETITEGSVDVEVAGLMVVLSLSMHVFVLGPSFNQGGQVQT